VSTIFEHQGPWRFDELAGLPDDGRRYEVVDGALVVSPPPGQLHQLVGAELFRQLAASCPPRWRVVYEWPLPLGTDGRVADLAVVRSGLPLRGAGRPYPVGPEHVGLVVEVVSPSSRKTDRFAKPGEYAEAGIPLFWRVETEPEVVVHAQRRHGDGYVLTSRPAGAGRLDVPWGSVEIDLRAVG
jgi:Uma2 family endonuclease